MATVQRDSYEMGGRASALIRHHSCVPLFSFALSVQLIIIYRGTHEWQRINATPQVAKSFKRRRVRPVLRNRALYAAPIDYRAIRGARNPR